MSTEAVRGFVKRWAKQNPQEEHPFTQDYLCAICRDVFYKPCSLACSHVFCRLCISKEVDNCRIRENKMKCPLCKRVVINVAHIRSEPKIAELQERDGCTRLGRDEEKQDYVFKTKQQVQQAYEQNVAEEFPDEEEDQQDDEEDSNHEDEGDEDEDEEDDDEGENLEEEEEQEEEEIVPVRRILTRSSAAIVVEQPLPKRRRIQPQVIEVD